MAQKPVENKLRNIMVARKDIEGCLCTSSKALLSTLNAAFCLVLPD